MKIIQRLFLALLAIATMGLTRSPAESDFTHHRQMSVICAGTWRPLCEREVARKKAEIQTGLIRAGFIHLAPSDFDDIFYSAVEAETLYGVDYRLVTALAAVESSLKTSALSHKGARGLLQVMPATAKAIWSGFIDSLPVTDELRTSSSSHYTSSVRQSMLLGVYYLAYLRDQFGGNDHLALASYNVGPARLRRSMAEGEFPGMEYALKVRRLYRTLGPMRGPATGLSPLPL